MCQSMESRGPVAALGTMSQRLGSEYDADFRRIPFVPTTRNTSAGVVTLKLLSNVARLSKFYCSMKQARLFFGCVLRAAFFLPWAYLSVMHYVRICVGGEFTCYCSAFSRLSTRSFNARIIVWIFTMHRVSLNTFHVSDRCTASSHNMPMQNLKTRRT